MRLANRVEPHAGSGGAVRNDISTALVQLYRELFGRGPVTTTTYAFDSGYVTFLRDILAPHERVLMLAFLPYSEALHSRGFRFSGSPLESLKATNPLRPRPW